MNCDCIKNIEAEIIGQKSKGRKVVKAELQSALVFFPKVTRITYSNIDATIEGRESKSEITMMHNYCPFCGVKIKDDEDDKSAPIQENIKPVV